VRRWTSCRLPFPDGEDRRRIWRSCCPPERHCAPDIDLDFLAAQFKLSGGSIRNCSLSAAFQAADDDGRIEMRHLVRAVALEYGKQGRLTLQAGLRALPRPHPAPSAPAGLTRGPRIDAAEVCNRVAKAMPLIVSVPLNTMLADLDEALRTLLRRELGRHGFDGVDVAFEAPAREWSGSSRARGELFLYDLRESPEHRRVEWGTPPAPTAHGRRSAPR
jgi:chitinase